MKKFKEVLKQKAGSDKKLSDLLLSSEYCFAFNFANCRLYKFDNPHTAEMASKLMQMNYGASANLVYGKKLINDLMFDLEHELMAEGDLDTFTAAVKNFWGEVITMAEVRYQAAATIKAVIYRKSVAVF